MSFRALFRLAAGLVAALHLAAQTPTPAQGRDYTNNVYRVVRVDAQGRLVIAPGATFDLCTDTTPCYVIGPEPVAAIATENPLQVSGVDNNGNVRRFLLRVDGGAVPANTTVAGADGVSNSVRTFVDDAGNQLYGRILPYVFDGTQNNRQFSCNNRAAITISGTDVVIVPAVAARTTIICHVSFSTSAAAEATIRQGTGSTCGTGTVPLTGAYANVLGLALDFTPLAALRNTAQNVDTCLHFSGAVTGGGVVIYAQF